ncbi:Solute carrier 49 member 4 [Mactra antiquata]
MVPDKVPLLSQETRVYKRRWWIISVFCLTAILQSMIWNTWGPIAESVEIVLNWTDGNVAFASNLADISYLLCVIPQCILMDVKGLRFSMLLCNSMFMVASWIRCVSLEPTIATATAYICAFSNGIAASIPFSAPPLVASVWFPPHERPVATAIGSFFNYFGISLSFIIGPQLVPGPIFAHVSNASTELHRDDFTNTSVVDNSVANIDNMEQGILHLLYVQSSMATLAFVLVLVYFPRIPPKPPSITASLQRTDYKHAVLSILRNRSLWLVVIAGALPIGITGIWIAILDVAFKDLGVSQIDAGWMGFWHTLIGCFSGIVIARFSEFVDRRRKLFTTSMFTLAIICCTWLNLICSEIIEFDLRSLYVSCILLGIFINGTTPLFYEMCVEASYPVAEGVTGGWYTLINNVYGIIFLSLVSVPSMGTLWMNWVVLGSIVVAVPLLFLLKESYKRTDIDLGLVD